MKWLQQAEEAADMSHAPECDLEARVPEAVPPPLGSSMLPSKGEDACFPGDGDEHNTPRTASSAKSAHSKQRKGKKSGGGGGGGKGKGKKKGGRR